MSDPRLGRDFPARDCLDFEGNLERRRRAAAFISRNGGLLDVQEDGKINLRKVFFLSIFPQEVGREVIYHAD